MLRLSGIPLTLPDAQASPRQGDLMGIQALGYLGVGSAKLDDWAAFATSWVGMQPVDRGAGQRAFRMDDRRQRLIVDGSVPEGTQFFGWEVADAAALDALAAKLEKAGVAVKRAPAALADQRLVSGLISFADPAGNRLEAFHGAMVTDEPFRPGREHSGFRTGPQGMGHLLMMAPDIDASLKFYCDVLGFRISDYMRGPVPAYFLHVNPRHHSLALVGAPHKGLHHLMVEMYAFDDLGRAYDIALAQRERIAVSLGRHSNDYMTSFYSRTPSQMLVEIGWGGREVDDATWKPQELETAASFWGHAGLFSSLGPDDAPPPPPMPAPAERHAPVQVLEGNYTRLSGVCPWWDSMRGRG
jgi:2,3-dihydroxybiphenyl 1,2-dioxygenase